LRCELPSITRRARQNQARPISVPATASVKAFSETDLTEDLKKFDVPTLILQGDDDQIVPYKDASLKQAKLVKGAVLKIYKGAPHGMCTTLKDDVNADLLAFIQGEAAKSSGRAA
jgi:non-heme chloroperoxidase